MDDIAHSAPVWAQWLLLVPLGIAVTVAVVTDWRERKIFNWLTYPTVIIGVVLSTVVFGWSGLLTGLLTPLGVIAIGLLILPFGWLGGGDIKLFAAIGALVGPGALFEIAFYSVFVGFLLGLSISLVNGYLWEMLKRMGRFFRSLFLTIATRTNITHEIETDERGYMPFAIPIFFGTLFAITDAYLQWPLFMDWLRLSMLELMLMLRGG